MQEAVTLQKPISDHHLKAINQAAFGSSAEIASCSLMSGGHFNTSYEIRTKSPENHVVLRIAPADDSRLFRYERTMMLAEPHIYKLLNNASVPTSSVLYVDGSKSIIDRSYILIDYIDALPMNHKLVPAHARPNLMRSVGELTAQIHAITAGEFGYPTPDGGIRGSSSWAEFFGEVLTETLEKALEAEVITRAQFGSALSCYNRHRAVFDECQTPSLVHNDIWDPNILVKEVDGNWGIAAIIDADRAVFADSEYEFALWDAPDENLLAGYQKPLNQSPSAKIRRQFYQLQLYTLYAWFYLVMMANPKFQAHSQKIVTDILQEWDNDPCLVVKRN